MDDIGNMADFEADVDVFQNITYLCDSKLIKKTQPTYGAVVGLTLKRAKF